LKWAGGKRWLVRHIAPLWKSERHRRLVEPLCGGLAVTLGLMPEKALLNDINPHIMNFYQWLKKGLRISLPLDNESVRFYEYRRRFNELVAAGRGDSKEAASLFYYLNRTCYNGRRFNRKGELNVETSPGNFQAWLKHGEMLDEAVSTRAAKLLAERYGGDLGSGADWRHFGRLAGFTNPKPNRRLASGLQPFARLLEASRQVTVGRRHLSRKSERRWLVKLRWHPGALERR
jgi:hypothetical protein